MTGTNLTLPLALAATLLGIGLLAATPYDVSLDSLLREMQDREALARLPQPAYRQLQASSYNRRSVARDQPGWFADQDGVSCIREEKVNGRHEWVIMEHDGPGCITRIWTPFFYYGFHNRTGPNVRVYLDGELEPVINANFIKLLTGRDFVSPPLAAETARAGDLYLPIPFARSCKITLDGKPFYHIVNYRAYESGTRVESFSQAVWQAAKARGAEVGRALLSPEPASGEPRQATAELKGGGRLTVPLPPGPAAISAFVLNLDPAQVAERPAILRQTVLRIEADGEPIAWCPVGDFFGSANALNPMRTWTRTVTADGTLSCRWLMPYRQSAEIAIENLGDDGASVTLRVTSRPWQWDERSMYFHAAWRPDDIRQGHRFIDWNFVDIRGRGVFVGDAWTVLNLAGGWWGEGDEKIYVDDAYERGFPDHFGTGTEDYYGWAGGVVPKREDVFFHPYLANVRVGSTAADNPRGFNICTRVRALDAIPFQRRLVFDMEASPGTGQRHPWDLLGYSAVSFWYARPGCTSNRPPLPDAATAPIMSLAALEQRSRELRRAKVKHLAGAVEFEDWTVSSHSPGMRYHAQRPAEAFRPDQWSGQRHLFMQPAAVGDYLEFTLTEQFHPVRLTVYVTTSYDFGVMDLSVNGRPVVKTMDLYSQQPTVKAVDLGRVEPVENAIVLRATLAGVNPRSRPPASFMGLDCLVAGDPPE